VFKVYKKYSREQDLHQRIQTIKKKISLASNKQDRLKYHKELNNVLVALGYKKPEPKATTKELKKFGGFRVAPTAGFIRVYGGGGCSPR